jgi:hypothetical protein
MWKGNSRGSAAKVGRMTRINRLPWPSTLVCFCFCPVCGCGDRGYPFPRDGPCSYRRLGRLILLPELVIGHMFEAC